ncbi:phosphopantetheine-binding protein [Micromonospora marina]|uniref:phosphopantetheine-binding protein n=1 Tax=Micromonospora marina TaxID=307120 RepID=UPI003D71B727
MERGIEAVVKYLKDRHPEIGALDPDQDLIDSRILDSLAFVEFIVKLEEITGAQIDVDSLTRDDIRTLRRIERRFIQPSVDQS